MIPSDNYWQVVFTIYSMHFYNAFIGSQDPPPDEIDLELPALILKFHILSLHFKDAEEKQTT